VKPFIPRRVKSDKAIIKDLPDKQEAVPYCIAISARSRRPP